MWSWKQLINTIKDLFFLLYATTGETYNYCLNKTGIAAKGEDKEVHKLPR